MGKRFITRYDQYSVCLRDQIYTYCTDICVKNDPALDDPVLLCVRACVYTCVFGKMLPSVQLISAAYNLLVSLHGVRAECC